MGEPKVKKNNPAHEEPGELGFKRTELGGTGQPAEPITSLRAGARFTSAYFLDAQFTASAYFLGAQFTGVVDFERARLALDVEEWPPGWTVRPARPREGEDPGCRYLVRVEDADAAEA